MSIEILGKYHHISQFKHKLYSIPYVGDFKTFCGARISEFKPNFLFIIASLMMLVISKHFVEPEFQTLNQNFVSVQPTIKLLQTSSQHYRKCILQVRRTVAMNQSQWDRSGWEEEYAPVNQTRPYKGRGRGRGRAKGTPTEGYVCRGKLIISTLVTND